MISKVRQRYPVFNTQTTHLLEAKLEQSPPSMPCAAKPAHPCAAGPAPALSSRSAYCALDLHRDITKRWRDELGVASSVQLRDHSKLSPRECWPVFSTLSGSIGEDIDLELSRHLGALARTTDRPQVERRSALSGCATPLSGRMSQPEEKLVIAVLHN